MKRLIVNNLGPIQSANIRFGDLTVLVGPQATGKSLFLQLFKLLCDGASIAQTLKSYGRNWSKDPQGFFDLYFGEGMRNIWHEDSNIISFHYYPKPLPPGVKTDTFARTWQNENLLKVGMANKEKERIFYVPAQRVLSIESGFPRPFKDFNLFDPYVLKRFSGELNEFISNFTDDGEDKTLFPIQGRLKSGIREKLNESIFHGSEVRLETEDFQTRLKLKQEGFNLPFMSWSTGQKEFVPLMLGLYRLLLPSSAPKNAQYEYVIIEEPEMGLHPEAIQTFMMLALELVSRGYKVLISTHSTAVLEVMWVINRLQENDSDFKYLGELFGIKPQPAMNKVFESLTNKSFQTYLFRHSRAGVISKKISSLDPSSSNSDTSGWGGLLDFSSRANEIVQKATTLF